MDNDKIGLIASDRTLWCVIVAALMLFCIDIIFVLRGTTDQWDHDVLVWVDRIRTARLDRIFKAITDTGGNGRIVPVVLSTAFLFATNRRLEAFTFLGAAGIAQSITYGLKAIVQRERPNFLDVANLPTDTSFPSGHALGSTVVYGMIALALWHKGYRFPAGLLVIWIALICFSRTYFGVHFPTDVLASICLGIAFLAATILVYQHLRVGSAS